jgi:hypothetical protein
MGDISDAVLVAVLRVASWLRRVPPKRAVLPRALRPLALSVEGFAVVARARLVDVVGTEMFIFFFFFIQRVGSSCGGVSEGSKNPVNRGLLSRKNVHHHFI